MASALSHGSVFFFCSFLFSQISLPSLIGVGLTVELILKLVNVIVLSADLNVIVNVIVLSTEEEICLLSHQVLTLKQSFSALHSFRERFFANQT